MGVTLLAVCLVVVVVFAAVGGGSYRRSRRRRLIRTAPVVTVHSPPPLGVSNMHVHTSVEDTGPVVCPAVLNTTTVSHTPTHPDLWEKDYPPPYSAVATAPLQVSVCAHTLPWLSQRTEQM